MDTYTIHFDKNGPAWTTETVVAANEDEAFDNSKLVQAVDGDKITVELEPQVV